MSVHFRGGELDGRTDKVPWEGEFWADWDPQEEVYQVTDEEGEDQGTISCQSLEVNVRPMPPLEVPKKFWQRQGIWSLAIFALSIVCWLIGTLRMFGNDLQTTISFDSLAYTLLVVAYFLKSYP